MHVNEMLLLLLISNDVEIGNFHFFPLHVPELDDLI